MEFVEVTEARAAFSSGKTLPLEFRRRQLLGLLALFDDAKNRERICEAMYKDMRKCVYEAIITEVVGVKMEIQKILNNLEEYTATKYLPRRWLSIGDTACIRCEPHGVVLILGTWNYPFYISMLPLAGAIAAGNCIILKPSEISENSAQLMLELLPKYLDNTCYHVVLGDAERTKSLLRNQFDYIFFTGSPKVGKSILQMAAQTLTPVTLELGGKSPAYIDESACSKMSVKRILWGKCINMGQTCVAPDYVICTKSVQDAFIEFAKEVFAEWYKESENLQEVEKFSRIINLNHFQRLKNLLDKTQGTILFGGNTDEKDLWIEPTFVGNLKKDDILLEGEIFGPILPIVTVGSADEAIDFINSNERPLALYIFSTNEKVTRRVLDSTYSGGVCINDTIFQVADLRLPFGGTGQSGMGVYHGKYTVETFSHKRAVITRGLSYLSEKLGELRYPPFTPTKMKIMERVFMLIDSTDITLSPILTHFIAIALGYAFCVFISSLDFSFW